MYWQVVRGGRGKRRVLNLAAAAATAAAATAATMPGAARAADRFWVNNSLSGNANWNNNANWSATSGGAGGASFPGSADLAYVLHNDPLGTSVLNPVVNVDVTILHLNIGSAGTGTPTVIQSGPFNLTATANEILGYQNNGRAGYSLSGGTNTVGSTLFLGYSLGSRGTYNVSGSGVLKPGSEMRVGYRGIGVVNQSGGQVQLNAAPLNLGYDPGSSGTYNLSGGSLTSTNSESIGLNQSGTGSATGSFVQTGGSHTASFLTIAENANSNGSYDLSGAASTLVTQSLFLGSNSTAGGTANATFTQGGGMHTAGSVYIARNHGSGATVGNYVLNGGAFTSTSIVVADKDSNSDPGVATGSITQSGGSNTTGSLSMGIYAGANGTYTLSGGSLNVTGDEQLAEDGTATFNQSGGAHTVSGTLFTGFGNSVATGVGNYMLSDSGVLSVASTEGIANGTFTQTGGSHTIGSGGLTGFSIARGRYDMSGGALSVNGFEGIGGDPGDATFSQSGGSHTLGSPGGNSKMFLGVGGYSGVYTLSGTGMLTINGSVQLGGTDLVSGVQGGAGVVNIFGGVMTVTHDIHFFDTAMGQTAVNLFGGTLNVGTFAGDMSRFHWVSGGTLNVTGADGLTISGGSLASVTLTPGKNLSAQKVTVGSGGILTLNGGGLTYSTALELAGGTIDGSAQIVNSSQLRGFGSIYGTGGFNNFAEVLVDSGTLTLGNSGANANSGNIDIAGGASLVLGGGSLANTGTIQIASGGNLNGNSTLNNNAGGLIAGSGWITTPMTNQAGATLLVQTGTMLVTAPLGNNGTINLAGPASTLAAGLITNNGIVRGDGTVMSPFTNAAAGEIRAESGKTITIANMSAANAGRISLQGGTAQFNLALTNAAAGVISGRGTLRANAGMTNNGQLQLIGGVSDVYGNITSNSGSKIIVSASGTGIFYNPITLNAGSEFRVNAGATAVFFGNVTGGSSAFTGSGTKSFENGASALGAIATPGDTVVQLPAALTAGQVRENTLTVDGRVTITPNGTSSGTSTLNDLAIGSTGRLDLTNNKLIVRGGGGGGIGAFSSGAYDGLSGKIASAYDFGAWDGAGITTSQSAAASGLTTLGIATADQLGASTFGGQSASGNDALVMYTYAGDANLDGTIDGGDYGIIDNFVQVPGAFGYANGDFNFDGAIDGGDYGIIDNNIQAQGAPFSAGGSAISGVTAVPEPGIGSLAVGIAAAGLQARRRRQMAGRRGFKSRLGRR